MEPRMLCCGFIPTASDRISCILVTSGSVAGAVLSLSDEVFHGLGLAVMMCVYVRHVL